MVHAIAVLSFFPLSTVLGASLSSLDGNISKKLIRREEYVDNSGSNIPNVTINVPLNNAGANNQSWINPAKFDVNLRIPYTSLIATAFSTGGGAGQAMSGGDFAGRTSGGGTRNEIYGTSRYGSGYGQYTSSGDGTVQYEPILSLDVSGRDFPHGFPPISFGNYSGGGEYYEKDTSNFPGIADLSDPSSYQGILSHRTDGLVLRKDKYTWLLLADAVTLEIVSAVLALPEAQGGCNYPYLWPQAMLHRSASYQNPNATDVDAGVIGYGITLSLGGGIRDYIIYPWNIMQFYRGSSVALGSVAYKNEFALNGNNNTNYLASSPLNTTDIVMDFFQCLNQTIAASIPIVNPKLIVRSRLTGGQIAGIVVGSVAGVILILAALWFWCRKRRTTKKRTFEASKGVTKGNVPEFELAKYGTPSTNTDERHT